MAALSALCAKHLKGRQDESKIDLTPMLDVVFILLIFFVVTTIPFDEKSMDIASQPAPPEQLQSNDQPDNMLISIMPDNRILFNNQLVQFEGIRARIAQVLAQNPQASAMIRADGQSVANTLVGIIDAAKNAGVNDIRMLE